MKGCLFIVLISCILPCGIAGRQPPFFQKDAGDANKDIAKKAIRANINSLTTLISQGCRDSNTVKQLNKLSNCYYSFSHDSVVLYAGRARQLAGQINYPEGLIVAIMNQGVAEEVFGNNWDAAIIHYRQAIEMAFRYKKDGLLHSMYSVIHNAFVYKGDFPQAMNVAREGLKLAKAEGNKVQMLHYTSLAGSAYFRQEIYDKSLAEYRSAEMIAASLNAGEQRKALNLVVMADIYCGIGDVYTACGDTAQAMYYLNRALTEFSNLRQDSSFARQYMIPNTLFKIGLVRKACGDSVQALSYTLAALDSTLYIACNKYDIAGYYLVAGNLLRLMKRTPDAKAYLYEGLRIADEIKHAEHIRDGCRYLSLLFAGEHKFDSAWHYNLRYVVLKDSITSVVSKFRTEEIKAIYDINEKNEVIVRQTNIRNILIASFAVLFISLVFLYNRNRLRRENRYQQEQNRQRQELFNAIAAAQELERKRIARDLHDGLGSVLSAAKLKMEDVKVSRPELINNEKFLAGISLIDEASAELRNISHNIMPATLSKLGLVAALKNLCNSISSNSGLQINFSAFDFTERIEEHIEISIYRIILELINNVVKHARAGKVIVQLVRYPDHINITVEDNGKGFDYSQALQEKKGIGLGNILSRVDYLKGTINIDAEPGRGTTVMIDVPF